MKKIKQLEAKIFANLMCEAYEMAEEMSAGQKTALAGGAGVMMMLGSTASVGATQRFDEALGGMLEKLYGYILGISTGLAVVFAAINIVKYMVATDPQSALMAKKSAIRVGIAWLVLNSLGAIAALFSSLAQNGRYTGPFHS